MRLPCKLVQEIMTEVKFTDGDDALRNKTKQTKEILPFVTTYKIIYLQSGHTESQKDSHETLKSISYLKSSMEKLSVSPTLSESVFSCSFIIVIFVQ